MVLIGYFCGAVSEIHFMHQARQWGVLFKILMELLQFEAALI